MMAAGERVPVVAAGERAKARRVVPAHAGLAHAGLRWRASAGNGAAARPGDIEADHGQGGVERVRERLRRLEAGADAVDQEQRNSVVIPARAAMHTR